ncbi:hypothetical protein IVB48_06735 [Bradyrhizobium sp. 76]|nr:hypothetical protein [Bradyrhizobium sp. 76]
MEAPTPGMQNPLRQARLYGYLIEREGALFHPGGGHPLCSAGMTRRMIEAGWLVKAGDYYELTPQAQEMIASRAMSPG